MDLMTTVLSPSYVFGTKYQRLVQRLVSFIQLGLFYIMVFLEVLWFFQSSFYESVERPHWFVSFNSEFKLETEQTSEGWQNAPHYVGKEVLAISTNKLCISRKGNKAGIIFLILAQILKNINENPNVRVFYVCVRSCKGYLFLEWFYMCLSVASIERDLKGPSFIRTTHLNLVSTFLSFYPFSLL